MNDHQISLLYVDDEQELLLLCKLFLERNEGFIVDTFISAKEALDSLRNHSYDAIISDYLMPVMDGIEFLKMVRENHGDIPFILFTGRSREEVVIDAINNGADFYLQKGGDPKSQFAELAHQVRQAVRRKQAEADLSKSEFKLRSFIEATNEAVSIIDEDGVVIEWNPGSERISGIPKEEALGSYIWDLTFRLAPSEHQNEERHQYLERAIRCSLQTGIPVFNESQVIKAKRPDGTSVYTRQTIFPIKTDTGFRFGSVTQDITEERRAAEALSESEKRFRGMAERSSDLILILDREMSPSYVSPSARTITGYDPEELVQKSSEFAAATIFSKSGQELQEAVRKTIGGEVVENLEIPITKKDGRQIFVSLHAIPVMQDGLLSGVQVSMRDISTTKEMMQALEQSEQIFQIMVNAVQDVIYMLDDEGKITYVNPRISLYGYRPEEVVSRHFSDFVLYEDIPKIMDDMEKTLNYGEPTVTPFRIRDIEGELHWVEDFGAPILSPSGTITGISGILRDINDRKKTEDELVKSQERFHQITENAVEWIWEVDTKGLYTYCNSAVFEILGYKPDELVGKMHFYELIEPRIRTELTDQIMSGFSEKISFRNFINPNIHKNGTIVILETSGSPVLDSQGKLLGYRGADHDITERMKTERALRESEEKFRSFVENANEVLYSLSTEGVFTYISPKITDLLGYDIHELIGKPVSAYIHPDDYETYQDFFLKALATGNHMSGNELRVRHTDGTWRWHTQSIATIYDDDGNLINIQGIGHDITDRKKIEETLRESEEKYRSYVENAHDIVFSLSSDGTTTYVSPRWTELLGHDTAEIIGKPIRHIHPDDLSRVWESIQHTLTTGKKTGGTEYRIQHKDGSWQWHIQSISPIRDEKGDITGIAGICHDITDRKKIEDAYRQANRHLSLLSSITRHDILNKITAIRGYLAVAEMECDNSDLCEYLHRMRAATDTIQSQIEFTRVYEELGSHDPQWISLDTVIPYPSVPSSATLTADVNHYSVFADPMLTRVFFNLCDNSIRHGQHVTKIRVSALESDKHLIIVWEDDGIGIPPEEKEQIFERGFGKNTGLGMFLAREILSLTGLTIRETGNMGSGARFEIMVPKDGWRREE